MSFIRISGSKYLNVNAVKSYEVSTRDVYTDTLQALGSGISEVTGHTTTQETVLKITMTDRDSITLYGNDADTADAVFKAGGP
jgi:hypothetical protein